jgi:uncharacterized membrane protein
MNVFTVALFQATASLPFLPRTFWPYFLGAVVLVAGLSPIIATKPLRQPKGIDTVLAFGPLLFAVPMAVFAGDHFIFTSSIARAVPSWIPYHLFWAYFVGSALIAAALSIATRKHSGLAAALLGVMLFCFVLLIHIPNLIAHPRDRIFLAIVLRDLSFSGGAFALAAAQARRSRGNRIPSILVIVRSVIGMAVVVFGVEHFLYPQHVPVVPLKQLMPSWIPAHVPLSYATGAILIACGLSMIIDWKSRLAAACLGIVVFVIVLLVYLPILVANLSDIATGLNYFADTMAFSGALLLLAGALPSQPWALRQNEGSSPAQPDHCSVTRA